MTVFFLLLYTLQIRSSAANVNLSETTRISMKHNSTHDFSFLKHTKTLNYKTPLFLKAKLVQTNILDTLLLLDLTNNPSIFPILLQTTQRCINVVLGNDDNHPYTAVECPNHLLGLDVSSSHEPLPNRRKGVRSQIKLDTQT